MNQKLFYFSTFFFIFIHQFIHGQNELSEHLLRATTSIAGSSENITVNNQQFVVQQSIGQSSVIGTFFYNNYSVRQGFIQPNSLLLDTSLSADFFRSNLKGNVHPNPFDNSLTISFSKKIEGEINIDVFDLLGRLVISEKQPAKQSVLIQLKSLPSATYILKIRANKNQFIKKIIKN